MKSKQDKEGSKKDVQAAPAAAPAPAGSASGVNSDFLSFMAASKARESDSKSKQKFSCIHIGYVSTQCKQHNMA